MLIILTGPPAAGKTTIATKLAYMFPKSVHLPVDTIRHFIKSGFAKASADNEKSRKQISLAEDITYEMIKKYNQEDYVVILDDVIGEERLQNYINRFESIYCFLLLPSLDTLHSRDSNRDAKDKMDSRVDVLYNYFSEVKNENYIVIDSSFITDEETANLIYSKIKTH